ncbi:MAG: heparin lyase I family protein [Flavihumibacter sp.]|nr:heparin lyase I family protein [Flavihumibacter sp.]
MKKLIACLLIASSTAYGQTGVLFYDPCESLPQYGWSNPYPNNFWSGKTGDEAKTSFSVSSDFSRAGNTSYRFEIRRDATTHQNDNFRQNQLIYNFLPAGTNTDDATKMGQAIATGRSPLDLRWISLSTLVPANYQPNPYPVSIGLLLKNIPDDHATPQDLILQNGEYNFYVVTWENGVPTSRVINIGEVQPGIWEDWVVERNFTQSANGFIRLYRYGNLVANITGPNWPTDNPVYAKEPYIKIGPANYGWAANINQVVNNNQAELAPTVLYVDEIKFGSSAATRSEFLATQEQPQQPQPLPSFIFYDNCEIPGMPYLTMDYNLQPPVQWAHFQGDPSVSSVVRSAEQRRAGGFSYKFELNDGPGNTWPFFKSELVWNFLPAGSPLGILGNTEAYSRQPLGLRWIAASTFIPSYNTDFNTPTSILFNTKAVDDDWPQPNALWMENGRYKFILTRVSPNGSTQTSTTDVGAVVKDVWEDWVLNRNYTSADSGYVRLFKNGQLVFEYLGGNWKDDAFHSKEPYVQMGIYKWAFGSNWAIRPDASRITLFIDEIRFGNVSNRLEDFVVKAAANIPPVSNAGQDQQLFIPVTRTTLTGISTDSDGTIYSKVWRKINGPAGGNISDSTQNTVTITNLQPGTYTYRFLVTDDNNAVTSDDVVINILPPVVTMVNYNRFGGGATQSLANVWRGGTSPNSTAVSGTQVISGDFSLQVTVGNQSSGAFIALDTDDTLQHVYTPGQIWMGVANNRLYAGDFPGWFLYRLTDATVTTGDFIRIRRQGDILRLELSKDNGQSWALAYTYLLRSSNNMWAKATFDNQNSTIYYPALITPNGTQNQQAMAAAPIESAVNQLAQGTKIYPNPANQWINVVIGNEFGSGKLSLEVVDNLGKLVTRQIANFQSGQTVQIDSRTWNPGSYFLIIQDDKGNRLQKKVVIVK